MGSSENKAGSRVLWCVARLLLLVVSTGPVLADVVNIPVNRGSGQDVYLESVNNIKGHNALFTGYNYGQCVIYEKYDLSSLVAPNGYSVAINSVTLGGVNVVHWGPDTWADGLYAVADTSWTYDNITWANKPALGALLTTIPFPVTGWNNYYSTPAQALTDFVSDKYATPGKLVSFAIFADVPSTSDTHVYNGSTNIYSDTYTPYISINYTLMPTGEVPPSQVPEINVNNVPILHPAQGSENTPIWHQPYFLGERELFGYHPRYIPKTVTFDADNRPYICVGMYANGHDMSGDDSVSLGVIQTLDDAGNWIQLNTFIPAIKARYATWNGLYSTGVTGTDQVVFDSTGDAYLLLQTCTRPNGSNLGFNVLLHSRDKCRTWKVYQLPPEPLSGNPYFFTQMELLDGHNDRTNPPVITAMPYGFTGGLIDLIVPKKFANGNLNLQSPVHIATADQLAYHTCMGNVTISKGDLVHVVFMRSVPSPDNSTGTPQYVVTYNRVSNTVGPQVFLGSSENTEPDTHDSPSITVDSQGYLHAILGAHHHIFKYTKSLVANSSTSGWTTPLPIGRPVNGGGWSYVGLLCDQSDTLHVVGRYAGYRYMFGLWYIRKTASGGWEDLGPLVMPFRAYYSHWYQRLRLDNRGRLFLNYMYYGDQYDRGTNTTYEIDAYRSKWPWENPILVDPVGTFYSPLQAHDPAIIMSDDSGTNWRIALTSSMQVYFAQTFENGLDGWTLAKSPNANSIQTVSSYTYNGKTILPRTGTTFARSETSSYYTKAIRTLGPAQSGVFTGYLNMIQNTNIGMIGLTGGGHSFTIMANSVAGKVSYLIDGTVTATAISVTTEAWHQVKFVATAAGLDGYWDGSLLFHSPLATNVSAISFGSEWASAPCGYDDFSFTPACTVQGQVNLSNFTGSKAGLPVTFELRLPGQTIPLETDTAALDAVGNYSFVTGLAGTYDLTAKAGHWLRQKQASIVLTGGDNITANFTLPNGDCDGGNAVNGTDLSTVLTAMDGASGGVADLDGNGAVDSTDLAILLMSMDRAGVP